VQVKEGGLLAGWAPQSKEVAKLVLKSNRIGVLHKGGSV